MALVVLLRGVNVGGHKTFRPSVLAAELRHLDAVNVGAAGTFVIRQPIGRAQLRGEIARRLPFEPEIMICQGREVARLMSRDFFAAHPERPDIVRFVSVMSRRPRVPAPKLPWDLPPTGEWLVKVLACEGPFVVGLYRRHMRAIGCLGRLDRLLGVSLTTRNWSTVVAIGKALRKGHLPA